MIRSATLVGILLQAVVGAGCLSEQDEVEDGTDDAFPSGKADGGLEDGSPEALGVLALVNDPTISAATLKSAAHITKRVAGNIVGHRDGADGAAGTMDDDRFDSLAELDAIPYVGPATLAALLACARDRGLVLPGAKLEAMFSPLPAAESHNARLAQLIRGAQHSVDVAIYSYSDAGVAAALTDAVGRGVQVRFLFEVARDDKNVTDPVARAATKSGKIEATGIDVRYVNKILHHKIAIIDGPRDDASLAATAKLVMGSANWSNTGATVYDEATIFVEHSAELAAAYQQEFDALWKDSRDFVGPATAQPLSTANITPAQVPDEPGLDAVFTRANFTPGGSDGTTWRADADKLTMSNVWVDAIARAQASIHIASGHARLRPVAEALIAKKAAAPGVDIRVYLDQQEFISVSGDTQQKADVETCKAAATTPAQLRDCLYNDFLFSKALVDAGIDVRFKSFAYRWDATYAVQMHSKYMIVDGKELVSGSYNLSMNSEHDTFENALHLTGSQFAGVVGAFERNFASIWDTGRAADLLGQLRTQVATAAEIPLVFPSMALTWSELDQLRVLIRTNCALADSTEYRNNPAAHKTCPR